MTTTQTLTQQAADITTMLLNTFHNSTHYTSKANNDFSDSQWTTSN